MNNISAKLFGGRLRPAEFVEKYAVLFAFVGCLFCAVFSFLSQYGISPGNLFFLIACFAVISAITMVYINIKTGLQPFACMLLFLASVLLFWYWVIGVNKSAAKGNFIFLSGIIILIVAFIFICLTRKNSVSKTIVFLFLLGFLIRFVYCLNTDINTRVHDTYGFFSIGGHDGYINFIYVFNYKLPEPIIGGFLIDQFYHPPLFYYLCALWWGFLSKFGIENGFSQESMQMLSLFFSTVCMITSYKILKQFKLEGGALIGSFAIMALHPTFIFMTGSRNNDILSVMFMLCAFYRALKWHESGKLFDIILCGLEIGLGMLSKLSTYLICVPIAVIFIHKFIVDVKANGKVELKRYLLHFGLFVVVCAPLSLFWPIRNKVLCNFPLNYVQRVQGGDWQDVGNYSAFERLFSFSSQQFTSVYDQWVDRGPKLYNEINPTISLIKTAVFEEYINNVDYPGVRVWGELLFYSSLALILLSVVAMIVVLVKSFKNRDGFWLKFSIAIGWIAMLISYYIFCFKYTYHCTMNMRYISPVILFGAIFIGLLTKEMGKTKDLSLKKLYNTFTILIIVFFSVSSTAMFYGIGIVI